MLNSPIEISGAFKRLTVAGSHPRGRMTLGTGNKREALECVL